VGFHWAAEKIQDIISFPSYDVDMGSSSFEESRLLRCGAVWSGRVLPMFEGSSKLNTLNI
jgi:hypothetical protein